MMIAILAAIGVAAVGVIMLTATFWVMPAIFAATPRESTRLLKELFTVRRVRQFSLRRVFYYIFLIAVVCGLATRLNWNTHPAVSCVQLGLMVVVMSVLGVSLDVVREFWSQRRSFLKLRQRTLPSQLDENLETQAKQEPPPTRKRLKISPLPRRQVSAHRRWE